MAEKGARKDKKWRLLGRKLAVAVAAAAVLAVPCSAAADHETPVLAYEEPQEGIEYWGGGIGFYWRSTGFAPVGDWGFELFLNARPKAWRVAESVGGSMGGTLQFNFTGGNTKADPDQTVTMVLAASAGLNYFLFAETTAELGLSIRFGGDQVVADHLGLNLWTLLPTLALRGSLARGELDLDLGGRVDIAFWTYFVGAFTKSHPQ